MVQHFQPFHTRTNHTLSSWPFLAPSQIAYIKKCLILSLDCRHFFQDARRRMWVPSQVGPKCLFWDATRIRRLTSFEWPDFRYEKMRLIRVTSQDAIWISRILYFIGGLILWVTALSLVLSVEPDERFLPVWFSDQWYGLELSKIAVTSWIGFSRLSEPRAALKMRTKHFKVPLLKISCSLRAVHTKKSLLETRPKFEKPAPSLCTTICELLQPPFFFAIPCHARTNVRLGFGTLTKSQKIDVFWMFSEKIK